MAGQRGFTYLGLLFAVAFIGLLLAAAGEVWHLAAQREREEELLFVGRQYVAALAAYYQATPAEPRQWPRRLEDLVEDRRAFATRRHLRRLYADPLTGKQEWGLVKAGEGIVGIYSLAEGKPLRQANFAPGEEAFIGAASYSDWRFIGSPANPKGEP